MSNPITVGHLFGCLGEFLPELVVGGGRMEGRGGDKRKMGRQEDGEEISKITHLAKNRRGREMLKNEVDKQGGRKGR